MSQTVLYPNSILSFLAVAQNGLCYVEFGAIPLEFAGVALIYTWCESHLSKILLMKQKCRGENSSTKKKSDLFVLQ